MSSLPDLSSSNACVVSLTLTPPANHSEQEGQLPLLKMGCHLQLFKQSVDGHQMPSKSTSARTPFSSKPCCLAKLRAPHHHTSTPWIPNFPLTITDFYLLTDFFIFYFYRLSQPPHPPRHGRIPFLHIYTHVFPPIFSPRSSHQSLRDLITPFFLFLHIGL